MYLPSKNRGLPRTQKKIEALIPGLHKLYFIIHARLPNPDVEYFLSFNSSGVPKRNNPLVHELRGLGWVVYCIGNVFVFFLDFIAVHTIRELWFSFYMTFKRST